MASNIKSFESEKQIEEKRKARQEEWERVRKPEDPVTAPEEEYDPRSLYDRLKEQRDKKQEDFEETLKFKNHFRGINQEESEFLTDVNKRSSEIEKQKYLEEKRELEDFKNAVAQSRELPEVSIDVPEQSKSTTSEKRPLATKRSAQQNILKAAVKRKAESSEPEQSSPKIRNTKSDEKPSETPISNYRVVYPSATQCVGILPGLAAYDNGSGSEEDDSSSDDDGFITNNLLSAVVRSQEQ